MLGQRLPVHRRREMCRQRKSVQRGMAAVRAPPKHSGRGVPPEREPAPSPPSPWFDQGNTEVLVGTAPHRSWPCRTAARWRSLVSIQPAGWSRATLSMPSLRSIPVTEQSFRLTKFIRLATSPAPQATSSTRSPSRQSAARMRSIRPRFHDLVSEARVGRRRVAAELPTTHCSASPCRTGGACAPAARRNGYTTRTGTPSGSHICITPRPLMRWGFSNA